MPQTCSICRHPQRSAIEEALLTGTPYRHIAARTGTSTGALQRHKAACVSTSLAKASEAAEVARGDDLLAKVRGLEVEARRIGKKAEEEGDLRCAIAGIKQVVEIVELLGRMLEASKKVTEEKERDVQYARIVLESAAPETDRPRVSFELEQRR